MRLLQETHGLAWVQTQASAVRSYHTTCVVTHTWRELSEHGNIIKMTLRRFKSSSTRKLVDSPLLCLWERAVSRTDRSWITGLRALWSGCAVRSFREPGSAPRSRHVGLVQVFLRLSRCFPVSVIPPLPHISSGGWTKDPLEAERHSLTPLLHCSSTRGTELQLFFNIFFCF